MLIEEMKKGGVKGKKVNPVRSGERKFASENIEFEMLER